MRKQEPEDAEFAASIGERDFPLETVGLLVIFPLVIFVGMAIQVIHMYSGPSVAFSPFVSVRFVGVAYQAPLEFSDFQSFSFFADLDCGDCDFDGTIRYDNSDETEDFVGMVEFGYRQNPGDDLWVHFFRLKGFDGGDMNEIIEAFLQFLRATERFAPGFELYEGYGPSSDSRRISTTEESSFFGGDQ